MGEIIRVLLLAAAIGAIFSAPDSVAASYEVVAERPFPVYQVQRVSKAQRLKVLNTGEKALISPKKYGVWRKLLVPMKDGSVAKGWAHIKHLKARARLQKVKDEEFEGYMEDLESQLGAIDKEDEEYEKTKPWQVSGGAGVALHISYLSWGRRSFMLSDETTWTVSDVTSTTYWPSLFVDLKIGRRSSVRFYAGYRTATFEGESTTQYIGTKQTSFHQTFLGLGLIYKFYQPKRKWWWGLGGEMAQGQELTIAYDRTEIPVSDDDLPLFIIIYGAGGYDLRLTKNLFLLPELRAGVVYNQDPRILSIEGVVSVGWQF